MQVWLTPDARGHRPQYGSTVFDRPDRHNRLLHILGGTGVSRPSHAAPGSAYKSHPVTVRVQRWFWHGFASVQA